MKIWWVLFVVLSVLACCRAGTADEEAALAWLRTGVENYYVTNDVIVKMMSRALAGQVPWLDGFEGISISEASEFANAHPEFFARLADAVEAHAISIVGELCPRAVPNPLGFETPMQVRPLRWADFAAACLNETQIE